ncbi:MAG: putative metal-binding motif-containing protein, partial [Sandaracinaceae bacterium]|nr:putative metal-binding motif-containing protein [Sandaracinaceae bacterium]
GGLDGGGTGACAGAADGAECGSMAICVAGACVASTCGDGVTDARTEECDDANDIAFDGCEPVTCAFTCTEATSASCDDANPCNGAESCALETHRCGEGMPLEDGAACTLEGAAGVCGAGECRMPGCHNGVLETGEDCDDGNDDETDGCRSDCTFTCATDDDCAAVTGTVCDGDETCDASHVCRPGTALVCDDGSACTTDSCDAVRGCVAALTDEDMDGHAPLALGACGDDCDDTNPAIYGGDPGAPEICDGIDNNCRGGTTDESAQVWYADCDGDGYAAAGATSMTSCNLPSATPCGGSGSWTTLAPTGSDADCDDTDAAIHPGASEGIGDERDQNCDGREVCYVDNDGDGHAVPACVPRPGMPCPFPPVDRVTSTDLDCRDPGEVRASVARDDCCDRDSRAYPGQTAYFDAPRTSCGGYDYDCDGANEQRYTGVNGGCGRYPTCTSTAGWQGVSTPPACGVSGRYFTRCTANLVSMSCTSIIGTVVQTCR